MWGGYGGAEVNDILRNRDMGGLWGGGQKKTILKFYKKIKQ